MSLASEWATSQRALEDARPRFLRQRIRWPEAAPYTACLALVADNGELQVVGPIPREDLPDFVAWLLETWAL